MYRESDGYFWIGGPGEEAFNVPLGLLVKKGEGLDHDYLHLHYRSSAVILAMGAIDARSTRSGRWKKATDPYSGGRNFADHYAIRKWNVVPCRRRSRCSTRSRPAPRCAQKRHGGTGITIVNGGDAGTAEGDFATVPRLVLAARAGAPDPVARHEQPVGHLDAASRAARRAPHRRPRRGLRHPRRRWSTATIPMASWFAIEEAMRYVRTERRPYLLEATGLAPLRPLELVGREPRAGGGLPRAVRGDADRRGPRDRAPSWTQVRERYREEANAAVKQVRDEPRPAARRHLGERLLGDEDQHQSRAAGED